MAVHDEIRQQQKKLKGQGFKAHWDYFWEYYKIHTIVAVIAIIFVVTFISDIANKKPYALYAMFINNQGLETQDYLQKNFAAEAGIDTNTEAVLVDTASNYLSNSIDSAAVATSEKIMALLAAKELDVMVADDQVLYHYAAQETFMDLRDVLSADELKKLDENNQIMYVDQGYIDYLASEEYSDYITTGKYDENNKYAVMAAAYDENFEDIIPDKSQMDDPIPAGIILDNSEALTACGAYTDKTPIAAIAVNTQRVDKAREFIEYLMK